ncbi:hypothetical protein HPP92_002323 [Vanilla planifolia]|uniref:Uncharacterized protein n=1 Tax=Vanilla planifolia TaxID=51239 RepID=A0A835S1K2_VANPL|nr:hypothetical protein HPP92_002323 [Vanilla planifolia]
MKAALNYWVAPIFMNPHKDITNSNSPNYYKSFLKQESNQNHGSRDLKSNQGSYQPQNFFGFGVGGLIPGFVLPLGPLVGAGPGAGGLPIPREEKRARHGEKP